MSTCKHGHSMTAENTVRRMAKGQSVLRCRVCIRESKKRYRHAHPEQTQACKQSARVRLMSALAEDGTARNEAYAFVRTHSLRDENGCWIWQGGKSPDGYGFPSYKGHSIGAHRLAFLATHGTIGSALFVCHKCNVRACCNPEHLYAGTVQDNNNDAKRAGTASNPRADAFRARTHCSEGHQLQGDNLGMRKREPFNYRFCKECERTKSRERNARHRERRDWRNREAA